MNDQYFNDYKPAFPQLYVLDEKTRRYMFKPLPFIYKNLNEMQKKYSNDISNIKAVENIIQYVDRNELVWPMKSLSAIIWCYDAAMYEELSNIIKNLNETVKLQDILDILITKINATPDVVITKDDFDKDLINFIDVFIALEAPDFRRKIKNVVFEKDKRLCNVFDECINMHKN